MSSSTNLNALFASSNNNDSNHDDENNYNPSSCSIKSAPSSNSNLSDLFFTGATTSQAIEAQDTDHFENTTFKLKRTRSLGLLDEFIVPTQKLIDEDNDDYIDKINIKSNNMINNNNNKIDNANNDDERSIQKKHEGYNKHTNTTNDNDKNKYNEDINEKIYNSNNKNTSDSNNDNSPTISQIDDIEIAPHDDTVLVYEPSRHVDYLSHNWKESDISKSWRYIILRRKNVANSARLENASWRTWAQQKYGLHTVSPQSVNWLKECDVTWLYGPIYKEPHESEFYVDEDEKASSDTETNALKSVSKKSSNSAMNKSSKKSSGKHSPKPAKPILKKRTVTEMMISHSNLLKLKLSIAAAHMREQQRHTNGSPILENTNSSKLHSPPHFEDDYDAISARLNAQYALPKTAYSNSSAAASNNNHLQLSSSNSGGSNISAIPTSNSINSSSMVTELSRSLSPISLSDPRMKTPSIHSVTTNTKKERHIHFNNRVEQCVAINNNSDDFDYDEDDDNDDDDDYEDQYNDESYASNDESDEPNDSDSDEEGGFFLKVRNPSMGNVSSLGFSSNNSTSSSKANSENDNRNKDTSNSKGDDRVSSLSLRNERYQTIELLPSTTLKYGSDTDEESNDFALSHNVTSSSRGYDYYYDYNSVYTAGQMDDVLMVDIPQSIVEDLPAGLGSPTTASNDLSHADPIPIINPTIINNQTQDKIRQNSESPKVLNLAHPSNPLPPQTTSKNASGKFKTFLLDSDSDLSEDEFVEDVPQSTPANCAPSSTYASLSEVAAKNSIKSPSVEFSEYGFNNCSSTSNIENNSENTTGSSSSTNSSNLKNSSGNKKSESSGSLNRYSSGIVNLLGGWKSGGSNDS